ncbi:MAG: hypothetical protein C0591_11780 [Marinilabiliales bacterium]|nr:MAG: hypothetical protein C0591_11780 [Marinilabiliales bacterium]
MIVLDVMRMIIIKQMIHLISQLNFQRIANSVIHNLRGSHLHLTTTQCISPFIVEDTMENGINVMIATKTHQIIPYLPVSLVMNKEKLMVTIKMLMDIYITA